LAWSHFLWFLTYSPFLPSPRLPFPYILPRGEKERERRNMANVSQSARIREKEWNFVTLSSPIYRGPPSFYTKFYEYTSTFFFSFLIRLESEWREK
jgi:hypothetical protein